MSNNIFVVVAQIGVREVFDKAQKSGVSHQRLMKDLIKLYQSDNEKFIKEFLQCIACCWVNMDKQPCYETSIEFAAKYCVYHENLLNDESFLLNVLNFIFTYHSCQFPAIRFRCCEFIYKILNRKGEQAMIADDTFSKIQQTMLERLQDKLPSIRAQAVLALQRLQDPYSKTCRIINAFLFHMEHDPSADVRAKIVRIIAATPQTLSAIFGRIYDKTVSVRKEAILTIMRVKVQSLTIEWRQKILKMGYNAEEGVIKDYISRVIFKWFTLSKQNFLELLRLIDVETLEAEVIQYVLFQLFREKPVEALIDLIKPLQTKEKLISFDKLSPIVAALWLATVKYLEKQNEGKEVNSDFDYTSEILPELTRFTKYIKTYSSQLSKGCSEQEFIMIQLIKIASTYSLSDEMGRDQLKQIYKMLLSDDSVEKKLAQEIIRHLEVVVPTVQERSIMLAEVISDIREPLLDTETSEQENYSADTENSESDKENRNCNPVAPTLEQETEERKDPETLIKCLTMVIEFMKGTDVSKIDGILLSLKDHFIEPCFKEDNVEVVRLAQKALALMCIWDLKLAQDNFSKFLCEMADDSSCLTAVECIFDLLLVHGFGAFHSTSDKSQEGLLGTLNNFGDDITLTTPLMRFTISAFEELLLSHSPDMRATVSQGLAKLFLASHINSPKVLANLLLLWCCPITEKEPLVRQPLFAFFKTFQEKRPGGLDVILNAVIPALTLCDEANDDHIYSDIDIFSVAKVLVRLTEVERTPKEGGSYHYKMAVIICDEMQRTTSSTKVYVMAKTLLLLRFSPDDQKSIGSLLEIVKKLIRKMGRYWEMKTNRIMEQFKTKIEDFSHRIINNSQEDNKQSQNFAMEQECITDNLNEIPESVKENDEDLVTPPSKERNSIRWNISENGKSNKGGLTKKIQNLEDADMFSGCSNESSDNDNSEDDKLKKTCVISETSESCSEDEDDIIIVNKRPNQNKATRNKVTAANVLTPKVLRSRMKRKST